jgi:ParB family chromosome partitioning protein
LASLGFDAEAPTVTSGYDGDCGTAGLFMRLIASPDEAIIDALAVVMAETLEAGTPLIEALGQHLQIDMVEAYSADQALLDLIKDREVLDAMVGDVAGQQAAEANAKATGKVKRQIIVDCLAGTNGRAKAERFVPRWMSFPPSAYTERDGVATVSRAAAVERLFAAPTDVVSPTVLADSAADGSESGAEPQPVAEAA